MDDDDDDRDGGEAAVAALELTLLSLDGVSGCPKTKPYYALAWLDPGLKQTVRSGDRSVRRQRLYFPLTQKTLDNSDGSDGPSSSCVTIQVLSPSRLPFHPSKLLGSAVLFLSSVRIAAAEALALPLRRPSGRVRGTLRVSVRILWDLGFGCVAEAPEAAGDSLEEPDCPGPEQKQKQECVESTAPPMLEDGVYEKGDVWMGLIGGAAVEEREQERVEPTALPIPEGGVYEKRDFWTGLMGEAAAEEPEQEGVVPVAQPIPEGGVNEKSKVWIGLIGGAVVVVEPEQEGVVPVAQPIPEGGVNEKSKVWIGLIGGAVAAGILVGAAFRQLRINSLHPKFPIG